MLTTRDSTENLSRIRISEASPAVRLSLDEHIEGGIRAQLATPTCSKPGDKIPALIGPLAAILQRCVAFNDDAQTTMLECARRSAAASSSAASSRSREAWHQLSQPCQKQNQSKDQQAASHAAEFQGRRAPSITIYAYLHRFAKYAKCSPVCFVMAQTYLERLSQLDVALVPGPLNVHRLLTVGIMLAAKLMDDRYFNNAYYAKIGGVTLEELNKLELRMMALLDYRLRVNEADISVALRRLTQQASQLPQPNFFAAFRQLLLPSVAKAVPSSTSLASVERSELCSADLASDGAATQSTIPATGNASLQRSDADAAAICLPIVATSAQKVTISAASLLHSGSQRIEPAGLGSAKQATSQYATDGAAAPDGSKVACRTEGAKLLSVRFSDQQHSPGMSTPLTAAALCAASLESDSRLWRASHRSSSVTSICSSGGSSCHRACVGVSLPIGVFSAC